MLRPCGEAWLASFLWRGVVVKDEATLGPLARPFTIPLYGKGYGQRETSLALLN